ncbi:hypothetical protein AB833_07235 [Chromatiales bacterium (ex Bugula neritina AB1)]|nr:hypothetical protein AB833_07235 [Chromatiales bacterium (ex Bugula neritina AB1)]
MQIQHRNLIARLLTISSILLFCVYALSSVSTAAEEPNAPTPPGTTIYGQAEVTYIVADTGESFTVLSNLASIVVGQYYNFSIESDPGSSVESGEAITLSHRITNTGNVPDQYSLNLLPGDNENLIDTVAIYRDNNGNGVVDSGEKIISEFPVVLPGETVDIVVAGAIPVSADVGSIFRFSFEVQSLGSDTISQTVVDEIVVEAGEQLALLKTADPLCTIPLFPEDIVTHTIEIRNIGTNSADGIRILVDGVVLNGFVVQLLVPSEMEFFRFRGRDNFSTGAVPVVRLKGAAENSWIHVDKWNGRAPIASAGLFFLPEQLPVDATEDFSVQFRVLETSGAGSLVSTVATVDFNGDEIADHKSNSTCHSLSVPNAAVPAELKFLEPSEALRVSGAEPVFDRDQDFIDAVHYKILETDSENYLPARDGVYLELHLVALQDAIVSTDGAGKRYVVAQVSSEGTGDSIRVVMLETATAGRYRSIAPIVLSMNGRSSDSVCPMLPQPEEVIVPALSAMNMSCILASEYDDVLQGRFQDSGSGYAIADVALVNPQATVFNSQTLLPVAGAVVSVRLAATDQVAVNNFTGEKYQITTGIDGLYSVPRLPSGTRYYIHVEPPVSHRFPSALDFSHVSRYDVTERSYGRLGRPADRLRDTGDRPVAGVFSVEPDTVLQPADIPLDSDIADVLLSVEKVALQSVVELGQSVAYRVSVKNLDENNITAVMLEDNPPYGFRYVGGTAEVEGESVVDPVRTTAGLLKFELGTIESGETIEVSYVLRSSAGSIDGDGVNSALAKGITKDNALAVSPASRTRVKLQREGVLSDRSALFGKIYVDQNCDGLQNNKEWPIGGVKFYLQDGTYTISDADGLYSIYGLQPGHHVMKIDSSTLPEGLTLKLLDSNQAADPQSRFIDLMPGDFYRADFAAVCPSVERDKVFAEIEARNQSLNGSWLLKAAENFRAGEEHRQFDPLSRVRSDDGDISSGVLDGPGNVRDLADRTVTRRPVDSNDSADQEVSELVPDPTEVAAEITQAQAKAGVWLWPAGELSIDGRFMAVVRNGIEPTLYVNGSAIPKTQIGERIANRRENAQVVAWYGVDLESGENTVEVKGTGPFGNERILASGTFKRPSTGSSIRLTALEATVQADGGRSVLPVRVEILDAFGYPALGVYFITIESSLGGWLESDIQDSEPGRQIRVNNGERIINFVSSDRTGEVLLRASTGEFSDEITVHQVSESRKLIAVGLLEAGASLSLTDFGKISPTQDLGGLDGNFRFNTRAAIFAKGRVKGNYNMTLSYDSEKDSNQDLLRDINQSVHYPLHGDASVRGYEAQSRSKLYLKLERDKHSLLWGDYLTDSSGDHQDLARSRRTFTGFNAIYDDGKNRLRLFAAEQENRRITEVVPGNGSALLYRLKSFPIVPNSEVVELITRSRDNPGLIIAQTRLSRFGDYIIDPVDGFVTFSSVVPTLDAQQNPVSVRIGYDLERGGEDYLVSGLRIDRKATENLKFGGSVTSDRHSEDGNRLVGAYASYELGDTTRLNASFATSNSVLSNSGSAVRLFAEHHWGGKSQARTSFTYARADADFNNSGAAVAAGRSETRFNHKQRVWDKTNLLLDVVQSESTSTNEGRRSFSALIESRLRKWLVRAGLRQVTQEDFSGKDSFVTSVLGVNRKISIGDKIGSVNAEYEQDTGTASRRRVSLGGKLQVHEKTHVYSNYELSNSLLALGGIGNNEKSETLTLGIETKVLPSARLYSEYRMRGAFASRDHETASGIRADYEIKKGLKVTPSFEFIKAMDENSNNDSIAASISVVDTRNPNSRRLARLEARKTDTSNYIGFRGSYAARVNSDWTAIITENLSRQSNRGTEDTLRHSLVAGLTRRPKSDNRHHMLLMYNWKEEKGLQAGIDRSVHLVSTHQNLQLSKRMLLTGRLGGKRHTTRLLNRTSASFAMLADVRLNFDFNRRINLDFRGGMLATEGMKELRYSAGAGIYYLLNKNARVGFSYNLAGFRDEDLDAEQYNAHGWHFGIQYKFDEDSLKWLE